jgi:hypothetical protein
MAAAPFYQPCLDGSAVACNMVPRVVLLICFMGFELHAPRDINTCAVRANAKRRRTRSWAYKGEMNKRNTGEKPIGINILAPECWA